VYGRIYLCDKHDGAPFPAGDETLAKGFANSLALLLDNSFKMEEISQARRNLEHLAHHDTLTGLPNRVLALDRLKLALAQAYRQDKQVALLFIDLDHFKRVNDTFGHAAGDQVLQIAARRLLGCIRDGDTLARLAGDEFLLLLPDIADAQDAATVAQKIIASLTPPCEVDRHEIFLGVSIGIGIFPDDAATAEDLLRFADTAMFHAKQEGRNAWQFFAPAMNERARRHSQIESALRKALQRGEMTLHYQPQVSLRDGRIVGMEALLRWHSAELGAISPADFIPIAEDTGLILPLGEWVLETACAQGKRWLEMGFAGLRMAVNVSARQFRQRQFAGRLRALLKHSGLPAELLELEMTESLLMNDETTVIATLRELRGMSIRISIDDFGTGYSSLSRLKKFPLSMLKIDQSFVRYILTDADDAEITRTIITLGRSLRLETIAEGVETPEHLAFLRRHGCDVMQGYLFSKPLPTDEFTALLREDRRLASADFS
jgi:diguanylate cyclase (GGDEF)-like protein